MERLTRCSACNLWQGSAPPNQHYLQGLQPPTSRCPGAEVDPRSKNLEILWMVKNGEKTSCITKRMVKKLYQKLGMFATYQLFHQMLVPFFLVEETSASCIQQVYHGLLWFTIQNPPRGLTNTYEYYWILVFPFESKFQSWWISQKWQGS